MPVKPILTAVVLLALLKPAWASGAVRHSLSVTLDPAGQRFSAQDRVDLPAETAGTVTFTLHAGLDPSSTGGKVRLIEGGPLYSTYAVDLPSGANSFSLSYGGVIAHPLAEVGEESARGQRSTIGAIGPDGVYLDDGSGWYPRLPSEDSVTFDMTVSLPAGWDAVSQGTRSAHEVGGDQTSVRWVCDSPQDGIWLTAGPWTEYGRREGSVDGMVFLRQPDSELAQRYLEATGRYLSMYGELIGPYPYGKFAAVENFWETGYGMPSFALLGPRVLRFPFILESSYPHEILHNWWGNSVYIDYAAGNWGEGLTAYLSDHLMKELKGEGETHRGETLQKYSDYVLKGRDLPLRAFVSRHGSVTEAVGYGKTMMLFHMLRTRLGDGVFLQGLREFFRRNIYRTANWGDVSEAFEAVSGQDLGAFFGQWVTRTGAPELIIGDVKAGRSDGGYVLDLVLRQRHETEPYSLTVLLAVTLEGRDEAHISVVGMDSAEARASILLPSRPLRVDVDPYADLFRRLDRRETPAALTQAFGAEAAVVVLPSAATGRFIEGYRALAQSLSRTGPGKVEITDDSRLADLPPGRSVWVLGRENRLLPRVAEALEGLPARIEPDRVVLEGVQVPSGDSAVVLTSRRRDDPDLAILWIAADNPDSFGGLGRKLPHYHKYSYLAFTGPEPENVAKGRWPVVDSPMTVQLGTEPVAMAKLPSRPPLTEASRNPDRTRMARDVRDLSSEGMRGRGTGTVDLDRAAEAVAEQFSAAGLLPGGDDGSFFQTWAEPMGDPPVETRLRNVLAVLPGSDDGLRGEAVVVGAHYDHLGLGGAGVLAMNRGRVHPGADDNASGVAVLLELARLFSRRPLPRTVVFAAFTAEEGGRRGSMRFVRNPPPGLGRIVGMVNLDTVGRLGGGPLLAMGASSSPDWPELLAEAGRAAGVEVRAVREELDSSDQVSFIREGVPALHLFTGAHEDYHRPSDSFDRIDGAGLEKVARVALELVRKVGAGGIGFREEPGSRSQESGEKRKVSVGTIPDFAYQGGGVRLAGTLAGSPAEKAGLKEGDVIVALDGRPVASLKDFSAVLRVKEAGESLRITCTRDGHEFTMEVEVEAR